MRFRVDPEKIAFRFVDGEAILINTATSYYYSLNPVGAFLWRLLTERSRSVPELAEAVAREYGQAPEAVSADIQCLLDDLKAEDLVVEE